jgi:hypothetical protein
MTESVGLHTVQLQLLASERSKVAIAACHVTSLAVLDCRHRLVDSSSSCSASTAYCYCYMVQDLPEHPVGSQRGSWGTSVIIWI